MINLFGNMGLSIILSSIILAALWVFISSFLYSDTKFPKGPRPFYILGNFISLMRLQAQPDQELLRIARKWGDICMLWYGSNPVVIVNTPRAAKDLLNDVCKIAFR